MKGDVSMRSQSENQLNENEKMTWRQLTPAFLVIALFHLIFIAIVAYFISPWSKVDTITVEGNHDVYDQLIINQSTIKTGDSIHKTKQNFQANEKKIIDHFVQISDAKLEIREINKIIIQVEEFDTVAYISKDEGYQRVLENGRVLDELYSISLGNQLILSKFEEGEALDFMIDELQGIEKSILNLISEIELAENRTNPLYIRAYMNNGNRVLAKIPEFAEKIHYYPQMVQAVEGAKGVFDMEAGIYFTPFKNSEEPDLGISEGEGHSLEDISN